MGGKASILLIMGFSTIFLVFGYNLNIISFNSVKNYSEYYEEAIAHNCAVSGANMAASSLFFDPDWNNGFDDLSLSDGTVDVEVSVLDESKNIKQILSTGTFNGITTEVRVILQPSNFAKFAYYSEYEPSDSWWTDGDTVWGPMHLQDDLRITNNPVFMGKVSVKKGIKFNDKDADDPKFLGGFESGVHLPLKQDHILDLEPIAEAGGHEFSGVDTVYLTFAGDSLKYRYAKNDPDTTVLLADFAPNGLIYVENGNARVKGVVSGNYSLAVWGPDTDGKIFIDDDIVYSTDPNVNPNSTDMLGLMARNDIIITDNVENSDGLNLQAVLYSEKEGVIAENYDSKSSSGDLNLYGSIVQKKGKAVGTYDENSGALLTGFNKKFKYDNRMLLAYPPNFPNTGSYEIVSWQE
jgi:hypothetical protein